MRKWTVMVVVVFGMVVAMAAQAAAEYRLTYLGINYRLYEDGRKIYKMWFELKDEQGLPPPQDWLQSATLKYNGVDKINLISEGFTSDFEPQGTYDGPNGQWVYDGVPYRSTGYAYRINKSTLKAGSYTLKVKFAGYVSEITANFNGPIKLPATPSTSITKKLLDEQGNLIVHWNVGSNVYDFSFKNMGIPLHARAMIDIYLGSEYVGCLNVKLPAQLGRLFVPARILELLQPLGDNFKLELRLYTNDGNNRYISKEMPLSLSKP